MTVLAYLQDVQNAMTLPEALDGWAEIFEGEYSPDDNPCPICGLGRYDRGCKECEPAGLCCECGYRWPVGAP